MEKRAIIIGAGPAGLTAAYELLTRTNIKPIILEKSGDIGGISKTVNYKGNRIDIGGHRFFSKSDRVMNWWMHIMPVEAAQKDAFNISYQNKSRKVKPAADNNFHKENRDPDKVMLIRERLSRIYFLHKFFTYPIQLSIDTLTKLGLRTTVSILLSYLKAQVKPRRPEKTLEDFMINRFGNTLYKLFFKDYTEKVWGVPCREISADWGAQRIKGISVSKAIRHAIHTATRRKKGSDISQKGTETSLIEQFLYPKYGPGQLWEEVARQVETMGGKILMHHEVAQIFINKEGTQVTAIAATDKGNGASVYLEGDYFFSTMPVKELVAGMGAAAPANVQQIAAGLQYRDFITVGILLKQLSSQNKRTGEWKPLELKDTWIYIQEKDVKVGRLQLFNNWSPYMVSDPDTTWVGMEFFCNTTDSFWQLSDENIKQLAIDELKKIGLADMGNVLDATVLRMEKTYPAYFGAYDRFDEIRAFTDRLKNLFLVGRNGMHKYNNSDHSMLTAMVAVDNIKAGITGKENIWAINTEQEYHEEKKSINPEEESAIEHLEVVSERPAIRQSSESFKMFIWRRKDNQRWLTISLIGIVLQLIGFKYMYPFADFFSDSYSYIYAAATGANVNIWPIGYSKFLSLFHLISTSDTALVAFQYSFVEMAALYVFFTFRYFYRPQRIANSILYLFLFFNPLLLYISNYVSSDALFLGLSFIWFGQLLWIINRPSWSLIAAHAVILSIAFTVRYNALYYPILTTLAWVLSRSSIWKKTTGVLLPLLLIASFVLFTSNQAEKITGTRQFSIFSGWQIGNNALYMYPYIEVKDNALPPGSERFHQLSQTYFRSIPDDLANVSPTNGAFYIKFSQSPLKRYLNEVKQREGITNEVVAWGRVAPVYAAYGTYLIKQHPVDYINYFVLPNLGVYLIPPLEKLEVYNLGMNKVYPVAQQWFKYKSPQVYSISKQLQGRLLFFYPILFLLINVSFVGMLLLQLGQFQQMNKKGRCLLLLTSSLWLVNAGFSVMASPVVLRYQVLPLIICLTVTLFWLEDLLAIAFNLRKVSSNKMPLFIPGKETIPSAGRH
jgi:protoporphyrinogen oxidase